MSELTWMEERRNRCITQLQSMKELSADVLERDHDALLEKLAWLQQVMEKVKMECRDKE